MTAPGDYQSLLACWTRKQSIAHPHRLKPAGTLANWASNRMITKGLSVHQRQLTSLTRSTPECSRIPVQKFLRSPSFSLPIFELGITHRFEFRRSDKTRHEFEV